MISRDFRTQTFAYWKRASSSQIAVRNFANGHISQVAQIPLAINAIFKVCLRIRTTPPCRILDNLFTRGQVNSWAMSTTIQY